MSKKYLYLFSEGNKDMREILGGKGANLAEMTNAGMPVPQGFTISTEACTQYYKDGRQINEEIMADIYEYIGKMEEITGKKFGDVKNPLLVSVRSGARASMPGMMDTILNLGLNDEVVEGLAAKTGNPRFAYDSYRRFVQMFSDVVMELSKSDFEKIIDEMKEAKGVKLDTELDADDMKALVAKFKDLYKSKMGSDFPAEYEKTCPQVFPTTAPGNFTQLPDGRWVMTTFYPYQWDLNYANPRVFNEMMYNFLYLANRGMDIIRIDAVPYIWKELGTSCRNLPRVHTIVRMMRMIGEIVCPSVILLGEVVMEPVKVVPYFGTVDKPECHLLYNVTTMCTTWHTVATHDTRLLRKQLDSVNGLPKEYVFLNYLRCHDDIGWGLDYDTLRSWGMEEVPHKKYLNEFFQGRTAGSVSRGELYNDDPTTGDARFCGTTASMCGLETAATAAEEDTAIRFDLCLHAMMLFQSGIPMLYSGDEIGQLNDYSYKTDPDKAADSRYVHRGRLPWARAAQRTDSASPAGRIFAGLRELETIRRQNPAFEASAAVDTLDTGSLAVLGIRREAEGEELIGLFNFGGEGHAVPLPAGGYADLLTGEPHTGEAPLQPYGFILLQKQ